MTDILVADDEAVILMELQNILEEMGYVVSAACSTADDARHEAERRRPDVVLMDVVMPGEKDGIQACREIQSELDIPVVLMTAHSGDQIMSRAMEAQPFGYVTKPFYAAQIKAAVEMALAKKAREREFTRLLDEYRSEARERELFFAVFESSPFGLAVISPQGRLVYTNKEFRNITGYGITDVKSGNELLKLMVPEKERRDAFVRSWSIDRAGQMPRLQEMNIRCADGSEKIVEARTVFLMDGTGVMSVIDITERRKALKALKESEYKFRTVAEYTYDWEFWLTPDWSFEYVSPSCEEITGHPAKAFIERPGLLYDITVEEERESLRAALEDTMDRGVNRRLDFRVRTRDGLERWLSLATQAVPGKKGASGGIRGSIRNITWRKQAEEALRRAEEKYRTIFEEAPVGIFRSSPEGRFTEVNPTLARMLGYDSPEEVIESVNDIADDLYVHPERREKIVDIIMSAEGSTTFENEYYRKDGETFPANLNVRLIRDGRGKPLYIEGTVEDVTQKKQAEALREDVERMARHDLKSPLISVVYAMRLLSGSENLTEEQEEIITQAEGSGYRMLNMLNLSLDLYRMETGAYRLEPESMDMVPLIRRIFAELQGEIDHKNLSAVMTVHGRPALEDASFSASGEELLCYSMFTNLIRNAIDASPEGETVSVDLSSNGEVLVAIHNKGAVPEEIRDSFFEKYVTSGKRDGSGLGAYGARLIARTHGGDVSFRTHEKEGTTVTVRLPKSPHPKA